MLNTRLESPYKNMLYISNKIMFHYFNFRMTIFAVAAMSLTVRVGISIYFIIIWQNMRILKVINVVFLRTILRMTITAVEMSTFASSVKSRCMNTRLESHARWCRQNVSQSFFGVPTTEKPKIKSVFFFVLCVYKVPFGFNVSQRQNVSQRISGCQIRKHRK